MRKVSLHEARTTLSQLIDAAEAGERVVLTRAGKSVAEIVRLPQKPRVKLGVLKDRLPKELLADALKPLSSAQLDRLFSTSLEP